MALGTPHDAGPPGGGGLLAPPLVGSAQSISAALELVNDEWIRDEQVNFAFNSLYALVGVLSLIAWFRNRRQSLMLWLACFALSRVAVYVLFLPSLEAEGALAHIMNAGPLGLAWLRPAALVSFSAYPLVGGVALSLGANILAFLVFSLTRLATVWSRC